MLSNLATIAFGTMFHAVFIVRKMQCLGIHVNCPIRFVFQGIFSTLNFGSVCWTKTYTHSTCCVWYDSAKGNWLNIMSMMN